MRIKFSQIKTNYQEFYIIFSLLNNKNENFGNLKMIRNAGFVEIYVFALYVCMYIL